MKLKEEFCWLYGVYLGDGFITYNNNPKCKNLFGLKAIDKDFVERFKKNIEIVTRKRYRAKVTKMYSEHAKKGYIWTYRISNAELCKILKGIDYEEIKLFDKKYKKYILRGLFDSEGCIQQYILSFCNTNKNIIKLTKSLLNDFNIQYTYRERTGIGSFSENPKKYLEIRIINKKNIKKFKEEIGFSIRRKRIFLEKINL